MRCSCLFSGSEYYWVGLTDRAHTGQYTWQHSWTEAVWTNWGSGEPDGGGQHCVMIWGGHQYYWADFNCKYDTSTSGGQIHALCEAGPGGDNPQHSVLWLGNSYTFRNNVPQLTSQLAAADGRSLIYDVHAESSWTWKLHSKSEETLAKIQSRQWDSVVLQEQSTRPAEDDAEVCLESVPYLDLLAQQVRERGEDTVLQFYLTWARPHGLDSECPQHPQFCSFSSMQDRLTQSYLDFACMKTPSRVAPVGEAFRLLHGDSSFPFLSLYEDNGSDHHASLTGSYLSAAVHYAVMFNTTVVGNTFTADLDTNTVRKLQEAATTAAFSRDWNIASSKDCQQCMCGCQETNR